MNPVAVPLALAAAVLHAVWNALLKTSSDPLAVAARSLCAGTVLTAPLAGLAWVLTGRPGFGAWPAVLLSAVLETVYFVLLSAAYARGELSVVYPIARGSAPLFAVAGGIVLLGERVTPMMIVAVVLLLAGIWSVRPPRSPGAAAPLAVLTGVAIAAYSTVDAAGVHHAPFWLYGWILWMLSGVMLLVVVRLRGGEVDNLPWPRAGALGMLISVQYLLVLLALRLAPLVVVAPLRESAVVLVALWGVWRLQERERLVLRIAGAVAILAGSIVLALS